MFAISEKSILLNNIWNSFATIDKKSIFSFHEKFNIKNVHFNNNKTFDLHSIALFLFRKQVAWSNKARIVYWKLESKPIDCIGCNMHAFYSSNINWIILSTLVAMTTSISYPFCCVYCTASIWKIIDYGARSYNRWVMIFNLSKNTFTASTHFAGITISISFCNAGTESGC